MLQMPVEQSLSLKGILFGDSSKRCCQGTIASNKSPIVFC